MPNYNLNYTGAQVNEGIGKAMTALQEHQSLAAYRTSAAQDLIDTAQSTSITNLQTAVGQNINHIGGLGNAIGMRGWNQLVLQAGLPSTRYDVTVSASGNGFKIKNNARTTNFNSGAYYGSYFGGIIQGHKYITFSSETGVGIVVEEPTTYYYENEIFTALANAVFAFTLTKNYDFVTRHPIGDETVVYDNLIDLTALFGSGNEPSSVSDFRAMFPADYYPYYPLNGFASNRNLLDNPWFTINQRGFSSYTGSSDTYYVDRWYGASISGISYSNERFNLGGNSSLQQNLGNIKSQVGNNYLTFSVVVTAITGTLRLAARFGTETDAYVSAQEIQITTTGTHSFSVQMPASAYTVRYTLKTDSGSNSASIKCTKIELGQISTIDNDLAPNYAEELLKCQRYFVCMNTGCRARLVNYSSSVMRFVFVLPVQMRATPSITTSNIALNNMAGTTQTGFTFTLSYYTPNQLLLIATKSGHGLTEAYVSFDGPVYISADL